MIRKQSSQRGFTLIEVLVALLIFAFGMLGAAGLLLSSMQATQYASNSVVASALAREYGELMQMIPVDLSSTATQDTLLIDTDNFTAETSANGCTGSTEDCAPNEWLEAVSTDWATRVGSTEVLPDGRGEVCRDSTPRNSAGDLEWGGCDDSGDIVLIKLGWLAKGPVGSADASVDSTWMTADKPQFAVSVMGNLRDYVTSGSSGSAP